MAVVKGTSAEDNIQAFSEVFSRHGVPRKLHSDNRAPFNGKDSHLLQRYLTNMGIKHITNKSTEDPEGRGLWRPSRVISRRYSTRPGWRGRTRT